MTKRRFLAMGKPSSYLKVAVDGDGDGANEVTSGGTGNGHEGIGGANPRPKNPPNGREIFTIGDDDDDVDDDESHVEGGREGFYEDDYIDVEKRGSPTKGSSSSPAASTITTITGKSKHVPRGYRCPLTMQLMQEPVMDLCGHYFEKEAIMSWLEYHEICPISRKPLRREHLRPADNLSQRIRHWKHARTHGAGAIAGADNTLVSADQCGPTDRSSWDAAAYGDKVDGEAGENDDDDDDDDDDDSSFFTDIELMLLPNERQVLHLIQLRAKERIRHRRRMRCLRSLFFFTVGSLLIGAALLSLKYSGIIPFSSEDTDELETP